MGEGSQLNFVRSNVRELCLGGEGTGYLDVQMCAKFHNQEYKFH